MKQHASAAVGDLLEHLTGHQFVWFPDLFRSISGPFFKSEVGKAHFVIMTKVTLLLLFFRIL